jgi:tricorn protease
MRHLFFVLLILSATALSAIPDEPAPAKPAPAPKDEARLLRFPTIHGDKVVFGYAGDLYTVSAKGGVARRLTSSDGYEMFPRFSPDGKTVAFTGQYDGSPYASGTPS